MDLQLQRGLVECARLAQSGQLDEAAQRCRTLVDQYPAEPRSRMLLGTIQARRGHAGEALDLLEQALAGLPEDADGWFNLALVYQGQGQADQAVGAYQRALAAAPGHLGAAVNLAALFDRMGQPEKALAMMDSALARNRQSLELRVARGALLVRLGRMGEAIGELEPLTRRPDCPLGAWLHLGIARARQGDLEQAVACYQRVLQGRPGDPAALLNLGKAEVQRGDDRAAEAALRKLLEDHPDHPDGHASLTAVLSRRGDFTSADHHARRALELAPEWPLAHFNRAALYSKRTRVEDLAVAETSARRALQLAPDHAGSRHCLAIVLDKLGQNEEALEQARGAVSLAPDDPRFAVTLGDLLAKYGDIDGAAAVFSAHPARSGELERQQGIVELKRRQPEAALACLDRALASNGCDQRAIAHRAVALQQLGRFDEASAYLGLERHVYRFQLAVPQGFDSLEAFNRALARDIRQHSLLRWEPIGLAARGGALTEELLADQTPAIVGFADSLRKAIIALRDRLEMAAEDPFRRWLPPDEFEINVWATLCQKGGNIDTHIHEESWLSGAYYVELPALAEDESDPAGWIEFGRPHVDIPFPEGAPVRLLRPEEGLLVLFPSYLFHRTLPHKVEADRISVSFDLIHKG